MLRKPRKVSGPGWLGEKLHLGLQGSGATLMLKAECILVGEAFGKFAAGDRNLLTPRKF